MSRRFFTLVEGTSNKFWAITLEGSSHAVEFGRTGTTGQSSRKEFGTEAEAKASHDKLVAEKIKKGYVEQPGDSSATDPTVTASVPAKTKTKPKTKAEEPEPVADVASETLVLAERSLDLEPMDWVWASWKPFEPVVPPKPKPFDRAKTMAQLKKAASGDYFYPWDWSKAKIEQNPSLEESRFWLSLIHKKGIIDPTEVIVTTTQDSAETPEKLPSMADLETIR